MSVLLPPSSSGGHSVKHQSLEATLVGTLAVGKAA